ncbi:hypothetical protein [Peribacillus simplex]|uniref:hypothetical protein n=1 Tax=Peribacillus simplex TaxID=1478 RepID=UPI003D2CDDB7
MALIILIISSLAGLCFLYFGIAKYIEDQERIFLFTGVSFSILLLVVGIWGYVEMNKKTDSIKQELVEKLDQVQEKNEEKKKFELLSKKLNISQEDIILTQKDRENIYSASTSIGTFIVKFSGDNSEIEKIVKEAKK